MTHEHPSEQKQPQLLNFLTGEITLRGLRIRRGTHPSVQDEDRVYPWTSMSLVSDGSGGRSCIAFDESGNPVAKWLVPENRRSVVRRVLRRAYVRAVRDDDLSVAEHVPGRGEAVVVICTLSVVFLALGGLAVHDQASASGGLANVQPSQLLWRIGGLTLFVLPIALFLLPLVIAPLRCNVAWWRLSMREGIEARLRTGEVERRPWSAVRRIRTSSLLVTIEFADGLVLRTRRQQRSGRVVDAWRERNEPGYRAPSRWGLLLALVSVMTASIAIAAVLPAYRQAGSWQAIPAKAFVLPLAFPLLLVLMLALLIAVRKWSQRRERMKRNRQRTARRGLAAPALPIRQAD